MKLSDIFNIISFGVMLVFSIAVFLVVQSPEVHLEIIKRCVCCHASGMMTGIILVSGIMWVRERWLIPLAIKHECFWACKECKRGLRVFGMTVEDVGRLLRDSEEYQTNGDIGEPQHNQSE